jgi:hypothetical protein
MENRRKEKMPDENKAMQEYILNNFPDIHIEVEVYGEEAAEVTNMPTQKDWKDWSGEYDGQGG